VEFNKFLCIHFFPNGFFCLAAESGEGKFVAFQKWAVLTLPITLIGIRSIMPRTKLLRYLNDFFIISLVITSIIPMLVYGARAAVIYMIYGGIVIVSRFGMRMRKVRCI
jgi:hypothetical protein